MFRSLRTAAGGDSTLWLGRCRHGKSRSLAVACFLTRWTNIISKHIHTDHQRRPEIGKVGCQIQQYSIKSQSICRLGDVATRIKAGNITNIVVMAGAGISTPSGIPDFRTPGTGLYDNLSKYNLPYAEAIFDLDYFNGDPRAFFALAKDLYHEGRYKPNIVHHFVKLLSDKAVLQKMYTQNIDGLERAAGIPDETLVEAHGTFATATCQTCRHMYSGDDIKEEILQGEVPYCHQHSCDGVIKPDVVFFGEQLPERFYDFVTELPLAHLLIVMGTSLEVHPFAGMASHIDRSIPRILFNKEVAGSFLHDPRHNDVLATGDIVVKVEEFCKLLGWYDELHELVNHEN